MLDSASPRRDDVPTVEPLDDADAPRGPSRSASLEPGTRVEVRNRLDGRWTKGFEVIEVSADSYRLRRLSDGMELPLPFASESVRKERRTGTWWY
jgi:hypothetical protein